jgi:hypothetical protein
MNRHIFELREAVAAERCIDEIQEHLEYIVTEGDAFQWNATSLTRILSAVTALYSASHALQTLLIAADDAAWK